MTTDRPVRTANRCPCGGSYEQRRVEVRVASPRGGITVLADVPQEACPSCGSRAYWALDLTRLEAVHHDAHSDPSA